MTQPQTTSRGGNAASSTPPAPLHAHLRHLPAIVALELSLIAAYLAAIFQMDKIACQGTPICQTYTQLEWSFGVHGVETALAAWTPQGRAAMALSAGLHVLSSFLFDAIFITGAMWAQQHFARLGWTGLPSLVACWLPLPALVFNGLYLGAHCTIAATVVGGGPPSPSAPVGVGVVLVLALALLVSCALFLIVSAGCVLYAWMVTVVREKKVCCCMSTSEGASAAVGPGVPVVRNGVKPAAGAQREGSGSGRATQPGWEHTGQLGKDPEGV